jgi:hypothetical protein
MASKSSKSSKSSSPAAAVPNAGIIRKVIDGAALLAKAGRAVEKQLGSLPKAPGSTVEGMKPAPSVVEPLVEPFITDLGLLDTALTDTRAALVQSTTAKKVTKVDVKTAHDHLKKAHDLFAALSPIDPAVYAKPYRAAFPDGSLAGVGETDAAVEKAVARTIKAIESLPVTQQSQLQALLAPLHTLDTKLLGSDTTLAESYAALRLAEARVERHLKLVRAALTLQFVDAPEVTAKVFPPAKAKPKSTPAPTPAPTP